VVPGGSSLADPSSAELADLVETMRREDVNVIFAETTQSAVLAEAVASELGEEVQVVELYTGSLGEPGSGADTVAGMLATNTRRIADALGGVRS
jgi:zinc/manganese transport system substrate-binding protein